MSAGTHIWEVMPGAGVGTGKEAWRIQGCVPELLTAVQRGLSST